MAVLNLMFNEETVVHRVDIRNAAVRQTVDNAEIIAKNIVNGRSKSCGCIRPVESHGQHGTRTYRSWVSMKQRCLNPEATGYKNYGARGITVAQEWMRFTAFLNDMGERPEGRYSLDRINNDIGYQPGNCVWATPKQQANNRRKRNTLT